MNGTIFMKYSNVASLPKKNHSRFAPNFYGSPESPMVTQVSVANEHGGRTGSLLVQRASAAWISWEKMSKNGEDQWGKSGNL